MITAALVIRKLPKNIRNIIFAQIIYETKYCFDFILCDDYLHKDLIKKCVGPLHGLLIKSCLVGKLRLVKYLKRFYYPYCLGYTTAVNRVEILPYACISGNLQLVKYLIKKQKYIVNFECFKILCEKGFFDIVKLCYKYYKPPAISSLSPLRTSKPIKISLWESRLQFSLNSL